MATTRRKATRNLLTKVTLCIGKVGDKMRSEIGIMNVKINGSYHYVKREGQRTMFGQGKAVD
jgi:hypothetical protein